MTSYLTYLAFRVAGGLVGLLPEPLMRRAGEAAGRLAWTWAKPRKAMAMRHMRRVLGPQATDVEVERAARGMFAAYGRYWAETFWFRPRRAPAIRRHTRLEGAVHLERLRDAGRPMIVALPHVGNWEMAATAGETLHVEITAVAEALANRKIVDWFLGMRASVGIDIVLVGRGSGAMRTLLSALAARRVVALLSDRDVTGKGVEVEFFGEVTTLPAGPAALSVKTGAPILPVASYFKKRRGHHIVIGEPIEPPGEGSREDRVAAQTQRLAVALEGLVRAHPEQWHLVQPNWPSDRAAVAARSA